MHKQRAAASSAWGNRGQVVLGVCTGLILVVVFAWSGVRLRRSVAEVDPALRTVTRVVDGDTFELDDGDVVRVLGVDTPETVNPALSGPEPFGAEATQRTTELVLNELVRLEADAENRDHYGRLLRHVWVGDALLAEVLVREGLGREGLQPQNSLYRERLRAAEDSARMQSLGIWGMRSATPLPIFAAPLGAAP